ncbi:MULTISPECIES: GHMP kinase [unclassified Mesorhizobium]|uniref:GHMP family kinase ATP-binding protein n=1 Tax=unclassified Mesorhizobium TaxID=325217 RepID=UPI00112CA7AE|nr:MULTISPECIES: GHMP kinase [unclassified Mesorhizobium]TPJ39720.1 GHMP kinase [Mesorhizobium sp. B2-6-6]MCA0008805.1 GHMP kinase [Mesorhizobium sp. B264B1B]MCA0021904.1 GHMP kinase [Mesorhizobium sp. B264B1A]MCA0026394.1 GHMP kinase [Mesorhizobium sp. B263B1A]MCA0056798.1 GHMP kinase [Mesorhizobium sp. B261B1A]
MSEGSGYAEAIGHHGELVQGVFEDEGARLRRALVSLPCRHLRSKARFSANDSDHVTVWPASREKARRAAELTINAFGRPGSGGHLSMDSNIPIGRGMGSSTADVLASILAVLNWLEIDAASDEVMQLAVSAETACDSTLFRQQAVLFAHRDGIVMEAFRKPLPPIDFISIDTTPQLTVDTLEFEPARYGHLEIETFRPLRSLLRTAIKNADARMLGRVATASARINERFLAKPRLREIETVGDRFGAIGVQVAHSGTVVGLMFDARDQNASVNIDRAAGALRQSNFEPTIFRH